jgi:hypothetical protein
MIGRLVGGDVQGVRRRVGLCPARDARRFVSPLLQLSWREVAWRRWIKNYSFYICCGRDHSINIADVLGLTC